MICQARWRACELHYGRMDDNILTIIRRKAPQIVLFRNTEEGTPVSIITTLSEVFGIEGFTISIS